MSRQRQYRASPPEAASLERMPGIEELGADLPVSTELQAGLLEIAVGAPFHRDGEARAAELESLVGSELEPPPALLERLRAIAERNPAHRPAVPGAPPRTATAVAASYVLAVALTLLPGDPVAAGRKAAANLGAAAGEHVLEPVAEAGSSMQAGVAQRFGAVQDLRPPVGFFTDPLALAADRVSAWFQGAVDSSSEAARKLGELWPWSDTGNDDSPPPTGGDRPQTPREGTSA